MKKTLALVIAVLMLVNIGFACAESITETAGEITFRGIPWGTNAYDVRIQLSSDGMIDNDQYIQDDSYIEAWDISNTEYGHMHSGAMIKSGHIPADFRIAGYPLSWITIYCPYSYTDTQVDRSIKNTKLMLAEVIFDVTDIDLVYTDLANKLTSLYGTSEEVRNSQYYINLSGPNYTQHYTHMIWYGANNTGVKLYKSYAIEDGTSNIKHPVLMLTYGKTDGKEYLQSMKKTIDYEKKNQDQIIQQNNVNNFNGL